MPMWLRLILVCSMGLVGSQKLAAEVEIIYVIPLSHTDIGFNAPPSEIAEKAFKTTQEAIAEAARDSEYRWNFETFWQFEEWLTREKDPRAGIDLLKQGRFGLSASYMNPHSSLMSSWALAQLFRIPVRWGTEHGLKLEWAVLNDVPGHPIDLPQFMVANGVKYLAVGANQSLTKPLPEEVTHTPFWWEGPDGSRVLLWISALDAYTEAYMRYGIDPGTARFFNPKEFKQKDPVKVMRRGIRAMLDMYKERKYPYDAVLALHGFDNWGTSASMRLPEAARLWNEKEGSPKIVISTPREFFTHIERKYGSDLPVRRGGFGGQWEGVKTAVPSARARTIAAEERLKQMPDPPIEEIKKVLVFYEHSFGMGCPWPDLLTREQIIQHNREQWEIVKAWPLPKTVWPSGTPIQLPGKTRRDDFETNGLYLMENAFFRSGFSPLPKDAIVSSSVVEIEKGRILIRYTLDRFKLPKVAHVFWTWKLEDSNAELPVVLKTATGTMKIPEECLGQYSPDNWIAPEGFQIGSEGFESHGPFYFFRLDRHPGWIFSSVLDQSLEAEFKGKKKGELTFDEAYPGEEQCFEFAITLDLP